MADLLKQVGCAGGAAVITVTFIHPIDVLKTRLQVSGEAGRAGRNYSELGIVGSVKTIAQEEGIAAFWKGIQAAWLRESSYTSIRLGLYAPIKEAFGADKNSGFALKFAAASTAGGVGSIFGNPFDVLKTSLMANEGKAGFSDTVAALYKNQGMAGFYRGFQANIMRAMVLNGTKMACYDTIKGMVVSSGIVSDGSSLLGQFLAAFGAGFFMVCTVAPFDMIRTRLMNQPPDKKVYNGFVDCAMKIVGNEGPTALYKGFIPIWSRFAPTTCLQLVIFERLRGVIGLGAL
jgi:hypothetical protein